MDNVCRTCLRVPSNLTSLYADPTLVNKIEAIASIQMLNSDDYYPTNICEECITHVNTLYNFRKVIINSDKELRDRSVTLQRLKSKPPKINEIEINKPKIKSENHETTTDCEEINLDPGGDPDDAPEEVETEDDIETAEKALEIKSYKCPTCGKVFASRFKLHSHKRTEHVSVGVCNVCGMVVRSDNLKRHVQLHFEGPVNCKHCGKVFKNSESLRGHMLIHRGLVYTCEICGRTCKVRSEYRRHIKTHTDPEVGKIMCTLCGKRVRDMKKHMYSHTGERPFLCVYCMKGFTSTYSLKVHTRQHTNEKPYICEYCPMAFPQKVSLVTHIRSKHKS